MKKRGFRAVSSLVAACMLSVAGMPTIKAYADELNSKVWSDGNIEVTYVLSNHWDDKYQFEVSIKNVGEKTIEDWCLSYVADMEINDIWNAAAESEDDIYVIHNVGYNQDIAPQSVVNFGFVSTAEEAVFPGEFQLISAPDQIPDNNYTVDFSLLNDWGSGYTAALTITNCSDVTLEDWFISFDWSERADTIWNARLLNYDNNHYNLFNSGYNQNIAAGESVVICLQNNYSGYVDTQPGNIQLYEYGKNRTNAFELLKKSKYIEIDTSAFKRYDENSFLIDTTCSSLSGSLGSYSYAISADYTIENAWGMVLSEGNFEPNENWSIENIGFVLGMNHVTINAYYFDGTKSSNSVWFLNTNNENMDRLQIDTADTDDDKLNNYLEGIYGTDPQKADTDGDGLTDYQELVDTGTNPLIVDSDNDGIWDGRSDDDHDGIDTITEYGYGTDPFCVDSDGDYLKDYNEIFETLTDPLNKDTDGDGAPDNWELTHGSDPLVYDDDFCVTLSVDGYNCQADLTVETSDGTIATLNAKIADSSLISPDIPGYVCDGFDFSMETDFNSAILKITFDEELLNDPEFVPAIYYLNEETQQFEEIATQWDGESNYVTATLSHFSTYILLNKTEFDKVFNRDFRFSDGSTATPLQIELVIDSSGSMVRNDKENIRLTAAIDFVKKLDTKDRCAVASFDVGYSLLSGFVNDKNALSEAILKVGHDGSDTRVGTAINKGLDLFGAPDGAKRYLIVLTDGISSDNPRSDFATIAKQKDVQIVTIGLGSGVKESYLKNIANATAPEGEDGMYYFASTNSVLNSIYDSAGSDMLSGDKYKDSNSDGITDEQTLAFCEGRLTTSTGKNPFLGYSYDEIQDGDDLDGDGIINGNEMSITKYTRHSDGIKVYSDPTDADTDGDGYSDSQEIENGTDPNVFNISDYDFNEILCNNDKFMSSLMSENYLEDTGYMIQLFLGNAFFNFKLQNVTTYEKALGTYIGILTDNAARMDFENMIEDIANNCGKMFLSPIYKIAENIPDVSAVPMDVMQYNNYLNLIGELETDLINLREFKAVGKTKMAPEYYEAVLANMEGIVAKVQTAVDTAKNNFKITGLDAYNAGGKLNSIPVKWKGNRKVTEILGNAGDICNKAGYVFIEINHVTDCISQSWALSSVLSVGNQYDTVDKFLKTIAFNSGNFEMQDAALNLSIMMDEKWYEYDLEIFVRAVDEIVLSGGTEMFVNYALDKCGPLGMAIGLGLSLGDTLFNVSGLTKETQATIAYGDAAVTLSQSMKYKVKAVGSGFYTMNDNDLELLSALAQLRIVGENQFYVAALEKRISIESLFGLKKEAKETMTDNVDDVYSITEKAPKLYSTREFSGTKL